MKETFQKFMDFLEQRKPYVLECDVKADDISEDHCLSIHALADSVMVCDFMRVVQIQCDKAKIAFINVAKIECQDVYERLGLFTVKLTCWPCCDEGGEWQTYELFGRTIR